MSAQPGVDPKPKQTRSPRKPRPIGVPGLTLCRIDHPASRRSPHNVTPGSLGERDAVSSSGYEAGRRRAIGVVAAFSINPRATTPMARRWAAGTPMRHGGPEGRCRRHGPEQRQRPRLVGDGTNPRRYTTIAGGTPALQGDHIAAGRRLRTHPRLVGDGTNPRRYTTIAGETPALQASQRPL